MQGCRREATTGDSKRGQSRNTVIRDRRILRTPLSKFLDLLLLLIEPAHKIMVLFVRHKVTLQTCMCIHPVGLDVWFLIRSFIHFHASCVRTAKTLAKLRGCTGLSEPSLAAYVISTIISCAGLIHYCIQHGKKKTLIIGVITVTSVLSTKWVRHINQVSQTLRQNV